MRQIRVFISSVQKEFAQERKALRDFLRGDPLLRRFFDVFLFEDVPAKDRRADELYLNEVAKAAIYIGIFGNDYGIPGRQGISPTHEEFLRATKLQKHRLIFVKGADGVRHPQMNALIKEAESQLVRRRFATAAELISGVYASLIDYLGDKGLLRCGPFDASICEDATLKDISVSNVKAFLKLARESRDFPLKAGTDAQTVLSHLRLLKDGQPTTAAILLFGKEPQRFIYSSEVKCAHFHGTQVQKPIPFYQAYKGNLFDLVDQAVNFVLSKINRAVGTRATSNQAPVAYEIPPEVIREAIVNAVAHRDYSVRGDSIRVSMFSNRIEFYSPGRLPGHVTLQNIVDERFSRNEIIVQALSDLGFIERLGYGIDRMIRLMAGRGLPAPEFQETANGFKVILYSPAGRFVATQPDAKKWRLMHLSPRQEAALAFIAETGRITNRDFQELSPDISPETVRRDLADLVDKGLLLKIGEKRATYYILK